MPPKNKDNGWKEVHTQHHDNELRTVEHSYRVFQVLMDFVAVAISKKLEEHLRGGFEEIVTAESAHTQAGFRKLTVKVVGVPRKKRDGVQELLEGIEITTKPQLVDAFVDPSRCVQIQKDLLAHAFWDGSQRLHKITIVSFKHQDKAALLRSAISFLGMRPPQQQTRVHADPWPTQRPPHGNGGATPILGIEDRICGTAAMPPDDAKRLLSDILMELEADNPYSDVVTFFAYLTLLEYHYIIACLGDYERTKEVFHVSEHVADAVIIKRRDDEERFTDRRPNVEKGDTIIATSHATGKVFHSEVLFVDKDRLYIAGNALERVKGAKEITFVQRQGLDLSAAALSATLTLSSLAWKNDRFDVIFDDDKTRKVMWARYKFAQQYGEERFEFLTSSIPTDIKQAFDAREHAELHRDTLDASTEEEREPQRRERGGRGPRVARADVLDVPQPADPMLDRLDAQQMLLISLIDKPIPGLRKIKVDGPGGTGKTEVLCCAAVRYLQKHPNARILYFAFTRNACNVAGRRLVELLGLATGSGKEFLRLHGDTESPLDADPLLYHFTNLVDPDKDMSRVTVQDKYYSPRDNRDKINAYSIVVASCAQAKHFLAADLVIIDEAAQCGLIEGLQALGPAMANLKCLLLLGGDLRQTTPQCIFSAAKKHLHQSLYAMCHENEAVCVKLRTAHRTSPGLTGVINRAIYNNKLLIVDNPTHINDDELYPNWEGHRGNPKPLRFIHIEENGSHDGITARAERDAVVCCVGSLLGAYSGALTMEDVVVLTNHREQQTIIRNSLATVALKGVRVTDADNFQGSEVKVVVVSLISQGGASGAPFPTGHTANSIVTRGKHMVIVVGNLNALQASPEWRDWERFVTDMGAAVETFDKTSGRFKVTFEHLHIPQLASVKEYIPKSEQSKLIASVIDTSEMKIRENPTLYFVGVVVGYNDQSAPIVRNLQQHHFDVIIDEDVNTSTHNQWRSNACVGDLVAVRLVPTMSRWERVSLGDLCHFRPLSIPIAAAPPPPHELTLKVLRQRAGVNLVSDFLTVPQAISIHEYLYFRPRGVVCCVLQRGVLPAVRGMLGLKDFVPHSEAIPRWHTERNNVAQGRCFGQLLTTPSSSLPFFNVIAARQVLTAPSWALKVEPPSVFARPEPCELMLYVSDQRGQVRELGCGFWKAPENANTWTVYFPVVQLADAPLPTQEETKTHMPQAFAAHDARGPRLVAGQVQEAVKIVFSFGPDQRMTDVKGSIALVCPSRPSAGTPPAPQVELLANAAAAQLLLKQLRPLALFVRQDGVALFNVATPVPQNTLPEVFLQPTIPQPEGPIQGPAAVFPLVTHVTRTHTTYFDRVVAAQLRLAALIDQNGKDDVVRTVEAQHWLVRVPQSCVWFNGALRCDDEVLSL